MGDATKLEAPADWLEALDESEAELAAGQTVPGNEIMRELHQSIARLEGQQPLTRTRKATTRR